MAWKTIFATLTFLFLVVPASADDCVPTTSNPEVTLPWFTGYLYIDNDPCQPDCIFSTWVYEETNGIEGLQRGDEVKDDTCGGLIESDMAPANF